MAKSSMLKSVSTMAKKRKTKQDKVIADLRRKLQAQVVLPASQDKGYSLTAVKPILTLPTKSYELRTMNYSYVLSDLKKTGLLTMLAIAAQAILYFVLVK